MSEKDRNMPLTDPDTGSYALAAAQRIRGLVDHAPSGGIFHGCQCLNVAGGDFGGFADIAGFSILLRDGTQLDVRVEKVSR